MLQAIPCTLPCTLSRSGFSQERVFRIELHDGQTYVGAAPLAYCYDAKGHPLKADAPAKGELVKGRVAARVIQEQETGAVLVSVPDGQVLTVERNQLIGYRPKGVSPDVPVQS